MRNWKDLESPSYRPWCQREIEGGMYSGVQLWTHVNGGGIWQDEECNQRSRSPRKVVLLWTCQMWGASCWNVRNRLCSMEGVCWLAIPICGWRWKMWVKVLSRVAFEMRKDEAKDRTAKNTFIRVNYFLNWKSILIFLFFFVPIFLCFSIEKFNICF